MARRTLSNNVSVVNEKENSISKIFAVLVAEISVEFFVVEDVVVRVHIKYPVTIVGLVNMVDIAEAIGPEFLSDQVADIMNGRLQRRQEQSMQCKLVIRNGDWWHDKK